MAKVNISATLRDGDQCQIVVKVGGQTLHFRNSGTQTIDLEPKQYRALVAGFQDPDFESTIEVEFKQGNKRLNNIVITEKKFIKAVDIIVQ
jgi:hypothetical protein